MPKITNQNTSPIVGTVAPTLVTPTFIGQNYVDTTNLNVYVSYGTGVGEWINESIGVLEYIGAYDASVNTYPETGGSGPSGAVVKGDMWIISVAGTLGGSYIHVGDSIIANTDTPGQTAANWDSFNGNISYVPEDVANKVTSISAASTDTEYPSAKLAYDQLALKVDKVSSTDNALPKFDGTTGDIQNSAVIVDDSNNIYGIESLGLTGTRVVSGWFTDLEVTNDITINGSALATIYANLGDNTDITSLQNTALYVGRDVDNKIDWATDDHLKITIAGIETNVVSITNGTADNDKLVTQGYVDDAVSGENLWDRSSTTLSPHTANDNIDIGSGNILATGDVGATASRITKGWFTDLEVTNAIAGSITGNAATVNNATFTTALTVNTGTVTLTGNVANDSVLTIGAGAVDVSGSNTGDQDLSQYLLLSGGSMTGDLTFLNPGTSANSHSVIMIADNSGTTQTGTIQTIYGANPYIRISPPNSAGEITATVDIRSDLISMSNDNTVDLGAVAAGRIKNAYFSGLVSSSTFAVGATSATTLVDFILGDTGNNNVRIFGTGTATQGLFHVRSTQATPAYMSFTEDNVADRAQIGIDAGVADLKFKVGGALDSSTEVFALTNKLLKEKAGKIVNVTTVNTDTYDLLENDYLLNVTYTATAAVTSLTLPKAQAVIGRIIIIKDAGLNSNTNNITIDTEGAEKIEGADTYIINTDGDTVTFYSDGTDWFKI